MSTQPDRAAAAPRSPSGLRVAAVMIRRELTHFVRQPARIAAAVGTPLLLWGFMAGGFAEAFAPRHLGDVGYAAFLLPGMMTLVAVFAAVFSSLSIIEDRQAGWLYVVLASPAPRWSLALGRIGGGALVAWVQAALLFALVPVLDLHPSPGSIAAALVGVAVTSLAMTAVGVAFAWRTETTGGFHAVMNLLFMPLWLLSGAIFPVRGAAAWLAVLTRVNPLAWCTESIRGPLLGRPSATALLGSTAFAAAAFAAAVWVVTRPDRRAS